MGDRVVKISSGVSNMMTFHMCSFIWGTSNPSGVLKYTSQTCMEYYSNCTTFAMVTKHVLDFGYIQD